MHFPSDDELMNGPNAFDGENIDIDAPQDSINTDGNDTRNTKDEDTYSTVRFGRQHVGDADIFEGLPGEDESDINFDTMVDVAALREEAHADSALMMPDFPEDFRAGFVSIVGRPNVGKSTLTNALVGQKIAITSGRPETTRHNIRGIVHGENSQLVLVDTPGYHRPRTLLGKRLNDMVREALAEVDCVVFCLPADQRIGPGDQFIARELKDIRRPVVAVATKCDLVPRERLMKHLLSIDALGEFAAIVPVSAHENKGIDTLVQVLVDHVPLSPPLYPQGDVTDESRDTLIAEFIREAALEGVRDELPHSLAVQVEEIIERPRREGDERPPLLDVHVNVYVERDSQKAIIIGKGGSRLKEIGTRSRKDIEKLLGRRIFLDLHVRTAKDWQSDPKMLGRLGF